MSAALPPRVFISSTLEDLESFRAKARDQVLKLGWLPVMCDYWAAGDNPPLATCLEKVEPADILLVIVAHRHGWTPTEAPGDGIKSITRLECEHAKCQLVGASPRRQPIDVIPFVVDADAPWDSKHRDSIRLESAKPDEFARIHQEVLALREFKAWLETIGTRNIARFANPDQLAVQIFHALTEWGERRNVKQRPPSNETIRQAYLDWLRRSCESVELLGLDLKDTQNVRLGQVYVPAVTPRMDERGEKESPWREFEHDESLLHRLGRESLYVPGAPGSGKSTFCRWLALCVASDALPAHPIDTPEAFEETLPETLRGRLPVLCRLREWSGHPECLAGNGYWHRAQLEDALAAWIAATHPGGLTPGVFRDELAAGHCLLILDGVDEVPEASGAHFPRLNLLTGLADALAAWHDAGNRVLLTSRPYGLDDQQRRGLALPIAELAELPEELQATFIKRWYAAADPARAQEKSGGLIKHLDERSDLGELRANPMLLTALCIKYDEGQRLPKDFYRLYDAVVSQVLHKRYLTENDRDRARVRLAAVALGMHAGDTTRPRVTPAAEVSFDEVDRLLAALTNTDWARERGAADATGRREDLLSNSGLLLPRPQRRAAFYHLSFQEFLAAVRLRRVDWKTEDILARHGATPAWRRTLTFLFCAIADQDSPESAARGYASLLPQLERNKLEMDPNPALLLADCLEVAHARGWNLERFVQPLRRACADALVCVPPPERAHLWRVLGKLGLDDRPGVGVKNGVPDIDWVEVPAGKFKYGDKKVAQTSLGGFRIARYPVTNAQFQCFIDDGGYDDERWWESLTRIEPERPRWSEPTGPRETVCWYEATAFCRWLDARLKERGAVPGGWEVRLPTEKEWEKAARGGDTREFPWGTFRSGLANIDETMDQAGSYALRQTTTVGIYLDGASPCGALDMAGNVWEWCADKYDPKKSSEDAPRVLRGGSCYDHRGAARCAYRYGYHPGIRVASLGFRLCCAPPSF